MAEQRLKYCKAKLNSLYSPVSWTLWRTANGLFISTKCHLHGIPAASDLRWDFLLVWLGRAISRSEVNGITTAHFYFANSQIGKVVQSSPPKLVNSAAKLARSIGIDRFKWGLMTCSSWESGIFLTDERLRSQEIWVKIILLT